MNASFVRLLVAGLLVLRATRAAGVTITEFPLPTRGSVPSFITAGADGNVWFTETCNKKIGRITTTGKIKEVPLADNSAPEGITNGPDGSLWFANGRVGRITTAGVTSEFTLPAFLAALLTITTGPDGNLWFPDQTNDAIGRITTTGAATKFDIPRHTPGAGPNGITAGPDGNVWFTQTTKGGLFTAGDKIGRILTTSPNTITQFPLPPNVDPTLRVVDPESITAGPDGNLWFTENMGNNIGRILPNSPNTITLFPVPATASLPSGITAGPDGNLWFTEGVQNRINQISRITTDGVISEFPVPTAFALLRDGITAGPDGNIWFTEVHGNKIGRITLTDATPAVTATETPMPTETATPSASPTLAIGPCIGDCNNDQSVTVDELLIMVNIALDNTPCCASCMDRKSTR